MKAYRVKLSFWSTPITIFAESIYHARQLALEQYRDSNGKPGRVEWVGKLGRGLNFHEVI